MKLEFKTLKQLKLWKYHDFKNIFENFDGILIDAKRLGRVTIKIDGKCISSNKLQIVFLNTAAVHSDAVFGCFSC